MNISEIKLHDDLYQKGGGSHHLYTLQHPTTLSENQTKQVALMSATNIPLSTEYLLQGAAYYFGKIRYYKISVPYFLMDASGLFWIVKEQDCFKIGLLIVFRGLLRIRAEVDMEAGVGIEPA